MSGQVKQRYEELIKYGMSEAQAQIRARHGQLGDIETSTPKGTLQPVRTRKKVTIQSPRSSADDIETTTKNQSQRSRSTNVAERNTNDEPPSRIESTTKNQSQRSRSTNVAARNTNDEPPSRIESTTKNKTQRRKKATEATRSASVVQQAPPIPQFAGKQVLLITNARKPDPGRSPKISLPLPPHISEELTKKQRKNNYVWIMMVMEKSANEADTYKGYFVNSTSKPKRITDNTFQGVNPYYTQVSHPNTILFYGTVNITSDGRLPDYVIREVYQNRYGHDP
jgi:hypothetical protein